ncbi:protein IQ-DOMAIN 1-like [Sesbania bispinosa]|nr:protein IQ-DOMAIN 1-like [Sesbania bispinosa]
MKKWMQNRMEAKAKRERALAHSFSYPTVPKYGLKLGVPPAKPLVMLMKEQ